MQFITNIIKRIQSHTVMQRIAAFTLVLFTIGAISIIALTYLTTLANVLTIAETNATDSINHFKILRGYYTKSVVSKVRGQTSLKVSFDHAEQKDTIPLPATMVHDLSDIISKNSDKGIKLKLYSPYPFPNRKDRQLDVFGNEAIAFLLKNPEEIFSRVEDINGKPVLRLAISDKMQNETCVNCHNTHPLSPKKDWKVNDVRGILEVQSPLEVFLANNKTLTLKLAGIVFSLMFVVLLLQFVGFKRTVNLEKLVAERTSELRLTLNEVQQLKYQQDGDYFLISLIAKPLMQNRTKSDHVKIEFFIAQKKKFHFRDKELEIGGDLCVSGNLSFSGKKYIMFFNGDAMGKSMQGAGGALVLGSVMNTIMARSAAGGKVLEISPEAWLKNTFFEIQRTMESFDGSMLASCVLGVIEEDTGKVMYFNAEHPFTILFRDGKAEFIENEISVHKVGFPDNELTDLYSFQMKPNDVIFCGSDGKDDIILRTDIDGQRHINEDERAILKVMEEANGELTSIYTLLRKTGELFDDISLIKIKYIPETNNEVISP